MHYDLSEFLDIRLVRTKSQVRIEFLPLVIQAIYILNTVGRYYRYYMSTSEPEVSDTGQLSVDVTPPREKVSNGVRPTL